MIRVLACASLLAIVAATTAGASPCPVPTLSATAVTPPNTVIEDGGGVIVSVTNNFGSVQSGEELPQTAPRDVELVVRPSWRFRNAGKLVTPVIDRLAPGLAVYRLPASSSPAYVLETGAHKTIASVVRSPDRGASVLGAPVVVGGGETVFSGRRGGGVLVTIHLASAPPRGAKLMIAYGSDDRPRSFGGIDPGSKDVLVWRTRGGCEMPIPGEISTAAGDKIRVAFVDASGRLSAKSAPIEITQEKQK